MAEQTLGDRDERLAANFDGTEFTECFPTSQGVSFRSKLGTAASRDVTTSADDTTAGRLWLNRTDGVHGLGATSLPTELNADANDVKFRVSGKRCYVTGASKVNFPAEFTAGIFETQGFTTTDSNRGVQTASLTGAADIRVWKRRMVAGTWQPWAELYHTSNTTVDGNGFIKEASPIIRLFGTGEIEEPCKETGAKVTRKSTGHYEITGTLGFPKKGWYIETPKDANGSIKVLTEYSQTKAGKITVKTYEPTGQGWRPEKGDPIDLPDGRWIDIRLEAPEPEPEEDITEETDAQ